MVILNENIFNLLDKQISFDQEEINIIANDILDDLKPFYSSLYLPQLSTHKSPFPYFDYFNLEYFLNFSSKESHLYEDFFRNIDLDPMLVSEAYDDYLFHYSKYLVYLKDNWKEISRSNISFRELENRYNYYIDEFEKIIKPKIEQFIYEIEDVILNFLVLKYYELMRLKLDLIERKEMLGSLEKFHSSPELIITVLLAIFSGLGTSILVKYLPDKEISLFRMRNLLSIKIKSFSGWVRRKKPEHICKEQIQTLEEKIDEMKESFDSYVEIHEELLGAFPQEHPKIKAIEALISNIEKKLKVLYELQFKLKEKLEKIEIMRRKLPKKPSIEEETNLVVNILFNEEKDLIQKINRTIEDNQFW